MSSSPESSPKDNNSSANPVQKRTNLGQFSDDVANSKSDSFSVDIWSGRFLYDVANLSQNEFVLVITNIVKTLHMFRSLHGRSWCILWHSLPNTATLTDCALPVNTSFYKFGTATLTDGEDLVEIRFHDLKVKLFGDHETAGLCSKILRAFDAHEMRMKTQITSSENFEVLADEDQKTLAGKYFEKYGSSLDGKKLVRTYDELRHNFQETCRMRFLRSQTKTDIEFTYALEDHLFNLFKDKKDLFKQNKKRRRSVK